MDGSRTKTVGVWGRRPLVPAAVLFAFGVVLGRFLYAQTVYIILVAMFMLAAFFIRKYTFSAALACLFFIAALLSACASDISYAETGENLVIEGRVCAQPYVNDYGSTVIVLDRASIDGQNCGGIKLYVDGDRLKELKCGNRVSTIAVIELPKGVRNPEGFDERLYLLSQGVQYKAYAEEITFKGTEGGIKILLENSRQYIGDTLDAIFPSDAAPVAKGMLLGDKQDIDDETYATFKDTGTAHILAVSGLHAGILIASVYFLLRLLHAGRKTRLAVSLVFIAVYACVTGLSPSIVRASIMACALLFGTHIGRQNDTLNYLSLAFIISLALNPLDLFNAGFQLSFAAVFGILTLGWQIKRWWTKTVKRFSKAGDAIAASAGATAGTLPILAASFNRIPALSVIINLIAIPVASAAIVLVFGAALIGIIFGEAASFAAFPATVVIRLLLAVIRWAAGVPFGTLDVATPAVYMILAFFVLLYISSKYSLIWLKLKYLISASICVMVLAAVLFARFGGLYIVSLDVGQGDTQFIRTQQNGKYFIDGGGENYNDEVVSFAIRNGYVPNAAFVSHTDDDHFSGIVALYEAGLLEKVYCSYQEEDTVNEAMPDAQVVPLSAGDCVMLDDYTKALVLYPYKDTMSDEKNDLSLVLLIEYEGRKALFSGDISGNVETQVFAEVDNVDIYKAAHHGSVYSSYRLPLSVLKPAFSIICVGKNNYGQPSPLALQNLEDYSGSVFTTLSDYAVEFYITGGGISVNTYGG